MERLRKIPSAVVRSHPGSSMRPPVQPVINLVALGGPAVRFLKLKPYV
jgi:hypothetical protein